MSSSKDNAVGDKTTLKFDLYSDPAIAGDDVLNPLTGVHNEHAPQHGIHLYHFPMSFFSQLARLTLEEKQVGWFSHEIIIVGGVYDQYNPDYVRINPRCVGK